MHLSVTKALPEEKKSQQIGSWGTRITKIRDTNDRLTLNISLWNQPAAGHRNDYAVLQLSSGHLSSSTVTLTQRCTFWTGLTQSMRQAEHRTLPVAVCSSKPHLGRAGGAGLWRIYIWKFRNVLTGTAEVFKDNASSYAKISRMTSSCNILAAYNLDWHQLQKTNQWIYQSHGPDTIQIMLLQS